MNNINKSKAFNFCKDNSPTIILNEPQLGENIGMVARAMLNCGLSDLRLVSPRHDINMDNAKRTSSKAFYVMDNIKIFQSLTEATQDINYIYATTARPRDQEKKVVSPETMINETVEYINSGLKIAYLFGKESVGLSNKDVSFANSIVTIPLNPAFSSLNLAQSVLICAYEWSKSLKNPLDKNIDNQNYASKSHIESLYNDIFMRLEGTSFFNIKEKDQHKKDQIRNIFNKIHLSQKETQLLRGIFRFINN